MSALAGWCHRVPQLITMYHFIVIEILQESPILLYVRKHLSDGKPLQIKLELQTYL